MPSTPMHGKHGALYRLRPNGFKGGGLNDATLGTGYSGADAAYYEIEIDAAGTPDTYQWRKDGGAYTTGVAITGAAQTLDEGQQITFAATTGHTVGDRWCIGNLKDEPTTESGATAQITESTRRLLNLNNPPTFTDDGGANVIEIDHVRGKATFDANVGNVDVDGNNGYIPTIALEKVGYLIGWSFDANVDMADQSYCGQKWKEFLPGQAGGSGSIEAHMIAGDSGLDALTESAEEGEAYFLLQLFNYDPDQDQTGDHFTMWVIITGITPATTIGEIVREPWSFQICGHVMFTENA